MSAAGKARPDWDQVLSAAARFQRSFPDAVLAGGTAAAIHAGHRISHDADHILTDLRWRFNSVLEQLESVAGWRTARTRPPVLILGSLDGIETGVRQLIRTEPLETVRVTHSGHTVTVPTKAEILRIKAVLILRRNALRDYVDFAAVGSRMTAREAADAMRPFDSLYPQESGESALQQLLAQLTDPRPFDLGPVDAQIFRGADPGLGDWSLVNSRCLDLAQTLFDELAPDTEPKRKSPSSPADEEIIRARTVVGGWRAETASLESERDWLTREEERALARKSLAEEELKSVSRFRILRRREIRETIAAANEDTADARRRIRSLTPAARPDAALFELAGRMTKSERQRRAAREKVFDMESDGEFFRRWDDPAAAPDCDNPPDRSLIFIVARPEHILPTMSEARRWHHFAVWRPGSDAENLRSLRTAFPEAALAPTAEIRAAWPEGTPAADFEQADRELSVWGVAAHIAAADGFLPEPSGSASIRTRRFEGPTLEP